MLEFKQELGKWLFSVCAKPPHDLRARNGLSNPPPSGRAAREAAIEAYSRLSPFSRNFPELLR
jgi:hypothetical protein